MNPFVIKKWQMNENAAGDGGNHIEIEGRAGGLVSWLLSLVSISPTVRLAINAERLQFTEGSLEGYKHRIVPLENISSSYYGYTKPWKTAVVLTVALGAVTLPLFAIGAIVGILYYFLNKNMTLAFVEVSGAVSGISFKKSVIEGINVDEQQAQEVAELTQKLIEAKKRGEK